MSVYKFTLSSHIKYDCPACGSHKRFTQYIDTFNGTPLADDVGKCDRINSCGYHKRPGEHFKQNGKPRVAEYVKSVQQQVKPTSFVPACVFKQSLASYDRNNFVFFLNSLLGSEATDKLIERYYIGTSRHWPGANIFWQVDISKRIRTGKIMLYNAATGKRVRDGRHNPTWVHKTEKLPDFNLKACLFGEHLLRGNNTTVALVESEKTAIIASYFLPEYLWLATGGFTFFTEKMCQSLKGRKVIVYPDLKCYDQWQTRALELSHIANFVVSDLLETKADAQEREQGCDIADYLINIQQEQIKSELFNMLVADMVRYSELFATGCIQAQEYLKYTLQIEQKLKKNAMALEDFVKATVA